MVSMHLTTARLNLPAAVSEMISMHSIEVVLIFPRVQSVHIILEVTPV